MYAFEYHKEKSSCNKILHYIGENTAKTLYKRTKAHWFYLELQIYQMEVKELKGAAMECRIKRNF